MRAPTAISTRPGQLADTPKNRKPRRSGSSVPVGLSSVRAGVLLRSPRKIAVHAKNNIPQMKLRAPIQIMSTWLPPLTTVPEV